MKIFVLISFLFCITITKAINSDAAFKYLQVYFDFMLKTVINESSCVTQIKQILNGVNNLEPWPILFLDASAKLPPSLLTGNVNLLGGYDQCMNIEVTNGKNEIKGQYCKIAITVSHSVNQCIRKKFNELEITGLGKTTFDELSDFQTIYYDACVPAGCSASSLQQIWDALEQKYNFKLTLTFNEEFCTTLEKQNIYSVLDILIIVFFSAVALIVISSTIYDIFMFKNRKHNNCSSVLTAFSFYTNGKRLFFVKENKSNISCLNGIKAISIAWVIVGHRTLFNFTATAINASYIFDWLKHQENMFIMGAFASVDTFFFISGFLIVYIQMMVKETGYKINIVVFYIHRILRLTPALAAIVLFHMGILSHLGSGPLWFYIDFFVVTSCKETWWSILLYVHNYVSTDSSCIAQTWYIAADTQLYFVSPLIVLPLFKWPIFVMGLIVLLVTLSNAHVVYTIYFYQLDGIFYSATVNYWNHLYLPTHLRVTPWLLGMLLGYYMAIWKNKKFHFEQKYVILCWIIAISALLAVMYGYIMFATIKFTLLQASIFAVLSRVFWSIGIGWIIFACHRGYGGCINTFLSLPVFTVLARISYSMFLTHTLIILLSVAQIRTNAYIDNYSQFHNFWGDYMFCVAISVIWTLTFESPVTVLEKIIFDRHKGKEKDQSPNDISIHTINNQTTSFKPSSD